MKTVVIYYSFTGKTKAIAEAKAAELNTDLIEIKEVKKRSTFGAYVFGSFSAMKQKKTTIENVTVDLSDYDKIVVAVPLWAGFPAPAFNNILELIPSGKEIELIITSGSGNSTKNKDKTIALANENGIKITSYQDIKTAN